MPQLKIVWKLYFNIFGSLVIPGILYISKNCSGRRSTGFTTWPRGHDTKNIFKKNIRKLTVNTCVKSVHRIREIEKGKGGKIYGDGRRLDIG